MKEMFLHSHRHEMLHFGNSTSCRSGTPLQITLPSVAVRELAHVRFCSSPVHFVKQRHLAGPTTHSIDIAVQLYSTPVPRRKRLASLLVIPAANISDACV